jgi:serine/threonine-protein kinase
MPALVGFKAEGDNGALKALEAFGLQADVQSAPSDQPKGTVVDQKPAAGEPVQPGSTVIIVVSSGPEAVEVPAVEGKKSGEARQALEERGFKVSIKERKSDEDRGTVIDQNPEAGEKVKPGSEVEIVVAR